jgi:hypothetical protein
MCRIRFWRKGKMMNSKSKVFLKVIAALGVSGILMNMHVPIRGSASEVEFRDQKSNSWISVSAFSKYGDLHFQWSSELPGVRIKVTGPNNVQIEGSSNGDVFHTVPSGNSQGEYKFEAIREISFELGEETEGSLPRLQEYVTSLRLGSPEQANSIFAPQAASASGQAAKTYLRYQTFIPDNYLGAPDRGCTPDDGQDYLFAGDGRGFDPNSSSFKTRFQVTVDWTESGALTYSRTVGPTKRYKMANNGLPILSSENTATATNEGMVLTQKSTSSTLTHYTLDHSVTNPMCSSAVTFPIWYATDVWIARSGAYTVTNEYRRAPNHELYLKDSDEVSWTALLQSPTYSMNCLDKTGKTQFFCSGLFKSVPGSNR